MTESGNSKVFYKPNNFNQNNVNLHIKGEFLIWKDKLMTLSIHLLKQQEILVLDDFFYL